MGIRAIGHGDRGAILKQAERYRCLLRRYIFRSYVLGTSHEFLLGIPKVLAAVLRSNGSRPKRHSLNAARLQRTAPKNMRQSRSAEKGRNRGRRLHCGLLSGGMKGSRVGIPCRVLLYEDLQWNRISRRRHFGRRL